MKFKEEKNLKKKFKKNELITHKPKNSKKKIKERTKKNQVDSSILSS